MTFQYCFDGSIKKVNNLSVSSPRTWGCFSMNVFYYKRLYVFPTHVGVFLRMSRFHLHVRSLPHARGGVSSVHFIRLRKRLSSPRTWGCFSCTGCGYRSERVFPTHVGVFLYYNNDLKLHMRLPHARGGVSRHVAEVVSHVLSSPRTWGCFWPGATRKLVEDVFPTHVGVFLSIKTDVARFDRLPHARGGVSEGLAMRYSPDRSSPRTWGCF